MSRYHTKPTYSFTMFSVHILPHTSHVLTSMHPISFFVHYRNPTPPKRNGPNICLTASKNQPTPIAHASDFDGTTTSAPEPTESDAEKIKEKTIEIVDKVAHEIGIPMWGMVTIIIGVCIVVLAICFWCIRRCCRKRRGKDGKKGGKGVDLKSVQLLGSAYKEKVRVFRCGAVVKKCSLWPRLSGAAGHGGADGERRGAGRGREQGERPEAGQAAV